jgi:hypothetical protein
MHFGRVLECVGSEARVQVQSSTRKTTVHLEPLREVVRGLGGQRGPSPSGGGPPLPTQPPRLRAQKARESRSSAMANCLVTSSNG